MSRIIRDAATTILIERHYYVTSVCLRQHTYVSILTSPELPIFDFNHVFRFPVVFSTNERVDDCLSSSQNLRSP
jgi:hypothetical protein